MPVGQTPRHFHFLTFLDSGEVSVEEHHFTISSSPTEQRFLGSTIKVSGDFTSKMGEIKPGEMAAIHGNLGRFSYVLHPDESEFVFVAGGIGVTP